MTPRLNCVDMSKWGGELTLQEASAIYDMGISNIKVGVGWSGVGGAGQWSRQQATTWLSIAPDCTVDAYIYHYMAGDPIQQVGQAFDTLAGVPVRYWWPDAEDIESPALSPRDRAQFLWTSIRETERLGGNVRGLYTGRWWWVPNMANTDQFANAGYGLWNSWYDGDPDTDGLPYGGWTDSTVEQYGDTQYVGGQSVDVNYDKTLDEEEEMPDPRVDTLIADIAAFKRAVFAGSEQPGDEVARTSYADYKIGEGGQSVNDTAQSALVIALRGAGAITDGMDENEIRSVVSEELRKARIVLGG